VRRWPGIVLLVLCGACSPPSVIDEPSRYHESRINHLVLHFTSENFARSLELLTGRGESRVSVHYLVPAPGDATYPRRELAVYRLVPESRRAWHAGRSYWSGTTSLNDSSVGIEIVNESACVDTNPEAEEPNPDDQACTLLEYPDAQIELVIRLAADILARNEDIAPEDVIAHGDIAPVRRVDPGPRFPWKRLYDNGIGAWYDEDTVARYRRQLTDYPADIPLIQDALSAYGYPIETTGEADVQTQFAVRAFQMHFRPADYSGHVDAETAAILFALLEKYRPARLRRVLRLHAD
jgi:N-acetylmuramoyl-L-alanine amidase